MKQGSIAHRSRMRHPRKQGNFARNQTFESNGGDVKIRGNPQQIVDKYLGMARDANSSGDRVAAENYFQHAEHYYRLINHTPHHDHRDRHQQNQTTSDGTNEHHQEFTGDQEITENDVPNTEEIVPIASKMDMPVHSITSDSNLQITREPDGLQLPAALIGQVPITNPTTNVVSTNVHKLEESQPRQHVRRGRPKNIGSAAVDDTQNTIMPGIIDKTS